MYFGQRPLLFTYYFFTMRHTALLLFTGFCISYGAAFAQVQGDECSNPYVINLQDPLMASCSFEEINGLDFSNFNDNTFTPSPSCNYGTNNNDIWVKITIPPNADGFKITMDSSVITTADNDYQNFKVAVYTGSSCGSLAYKTCKSSSRDKVYNNYFDGFAPGDQVYARIYTHNSPSGTWDKPFFARFTPISTSQSNDACSKATALMPGNYCNYLATDKGENDNKAPDKLTGTSSVCNPGTSDFGSFDNNQWYFFEVTAATPQPVTITITSVNCNVGDKVIQTAIWKANTLNCASWGNGYELNNPSAASEGDLLACAVGTGVISISENLPLGKYWYTVDGSAGSFCEYAITEAPVITVPVELLAFYSEKTGDEIFLKWSCTETDETLLFILEYSPDGYSFYNQEILYAGTPQNTITHFQTLAKQSGYYRLTIREQNGNESYSRVLPVTKSVEKISVNVYYTSNELKLFYEGEKKSGMEIRLFHPNGSEIMHVQKELEPGENSLPEFSNNPATGIYFLQLISPDYSKTHKLLVE